MAWLGVDALPYTADASCSGSCTFTGALAAFGTLSLCCIPPGHVLMDLQIPADSAAFS